MIHDKALILSMVKFSLIGDLLTMSKIKMITSKIKMTIVSNDSRVNGLFGIYNGSLRLYLGYIMYF